MLESSPCVENLLKRYTSLKYNDTRTRIICNLTQHEMMPNEKAIMGYVEGKKYQSLIARLNKEIEREEVDPGEIKTADLVDTLREKYFEFLVAPKNPKRKYFLLRFPPFFALIIHSF